MAVLSESGDRARAGRRQLIGTCSAKPQAPLNTGAATRLAVDMVGRCALSAPAEVPSTVVSQGSKRFGISASHLGL
jgi:hypothetical protein